MTDRASSVSEKGAWMIVRPAARPRWIGAILAVVAFAAVLVSQRSQGIARDEVVYMTAGERYAGWWLDLVTGGDGVLTERRIDSVFGGPLGGVGNPEHPPLWKTAFGMSERVLHQWLGLTGRVTAHRVPAAFAFALWVWLVAAMAGWIWGAAVGALSGGLVLLMPRLFFHAGFAAFDIPAATLWFAVVYCYFRALADRRWVIALGVAYGLLLATKHNALVVPAALAVHYVLVCAQLARAAVASDATGWMAVRQFFRHLGRQLWTLRPSVFLAMIGLGPLVLIVLWPWLWFDTWAHLHAWIGFHLRHVHYNYEYLGRNWNAPPFPWHVPIVTTAVVVPVGTLLAFVLGAGRLAYAAWLGKPVLGSARAGEYDGWAMPALLLFLSAGAAMGPFVLGSTPIFGAEKHWAVAFATIAMFAAIGVVWAARSAGAPLLALVPALRATRGDADASDGGVRRVVRKRVIALVSVLVVGAAAIETYRAQPYGLSHYSALVGGPAGGADLGMNRQFWGYAARGVLPWLNQHAVGATARVKVYAHDASPAWGLYHREGLLDGRLIDGGREEAGVRASDCAIVIHERHFNRHDYMVWRQYGTVQPAFVLTDSGVPLVSVYRRAP